MAPVRITKDLPGHEIDIWPNGIRWTGTDYVISSLCGFGCECGVDFTGDDPYGQHEYHIEQVVNTLQKRRWTEVIIRRAEKQKESKP